MVYSIFTDKYWKRLENSGEYSTLSFSEVIRTWEEQVAIYVHKIIQDRLNIHIRIVYFVVMILESCRVSETHATPLLYQL